MFKKFAGILFLFVALQAQSQQQPEWVYSTVKGDTLWDICLKYTNKRGCWITLTKYNEVANDREIPVNTPIRIPVGWLKQLPVVGEVVYAAGVAEYSQWNDKKFVSLTAGQQVHLGSIIRTQASSIVKLLLHQTNEVLIKENSELLLEKFSSANVNVLDEEITLKQGSADVEVNSNKVKNRFIIKTPAAIAAVRGTQFRINSSGDQMRGEVLEGKIDVSTDSSNQSVPAGFGVSATKGKKIQPPQALPPQPKILKASVKSSLPARIDWEPLSQVGQYQVSLYDSKKKILSIETVDHNWIVYDAIDKGCYLVKVHGIDSAGFHGLDNQASLCVMDDLASVNLDEDSLEGEGDHLALSWQNVPEANGYRVQVSTDEQFSDIVQDTTTSDAQVELPKIEGQHVYIRVISMDDNGRESLPSNVLEHSDKKSQMFSIIVTTLLVGIAFL